MSEVILFFAGCNFLIVVWSFMWKNSFLDDTRDKLFDLREETRKHFLENDLSLDHKTYKNLRNLLNGHIRFLEEFTIFTIIAHLRFYKENNKSISKAIENFDKLFVSEDESLNKFSDKIRNQAMNILILHLFKTSSVLMTVTTIGIVILVFKGLSIGIKRLYDVADKIIDKKYIEELSFNRAL